MFLFPVYVCVPGGLLTTFAIYSIYWDGLGNSHLAESKKSIRILSGSVLRYSQLRVRI